MVGSGAVDPPGVFALSFAKLHKAEYPTPAIFDNDFVFPILLYQRPSSWRAETAGELLEDLSDSLARDCTCH